MIPPVKDIISTLSSMPEEARAEVRHCIGHSALATTNVVKTMASILSDLSSEGDLWAMIMLTSLDGGLIMAEAKSKQDADTAVAMLLKMVNSVAPQLDRHLHERALARQRKVLHESLHGLEQSRQDLLALINARLGRN